MNIINSIKNACRAIVDAVDSNSIVINGKHYSGNSIVVKGNSVYIDGELAKDCTGDIIANTIKGNTSTVSGNIRKRH